MSDDERKKRPPRGADDPFDDGLGGLGDLFSSMFNVKPKGEDSKDGKDATESKPSGLSELVSGFFEAITGETPAPKRSEPKQPRADSRTPPRGSSRPGYSKEYEDLLRIYGIDPNFDFRTAYPQPRPAPAPRSPRQLQHDALVRDLYKGLRDLDRRSLAEVVVSSEELVRSLHTQQLLRVHAYAAVSAGNYDLALRSLRDLKEPTPQELATRGMLGHLKGKPEALTDLRLAYDALKDKSDAPYFPRLVAALSAENFINGTKKLEAHLDLLKPYQDKDPIVNTVLGVIHYNTDNVVMASYFFEEASERMPADYATRLNLLRSLTARHGGDIDYTEVAAFYAATHATLSENELRSEIFVTEIPVPRVRVDSYESILDIPAFTARFFDRAKNTKK